MHINGQRVVIKIIPVMGVPKERMRPREIAVDEAELGEKPFLSSTVMSAKLLTRILNEVTCLKN